MKSDALKMKKQKTDNPLKSSGWKGGSSKPKGNAGKNQTGKQGSIRSGSGKRK